MKNTERFYLDWIEAELFKTSECKNFNGYINGTGSLNITDVDVNDGMGYLVNVRVENEGFFVALALFCFFDDVL
jgi:hypothetical protein